MYSKILKQILKEIKPQRKLERKINLLAEKSLRITRRLAKKHRAEVMLVGSITRNTWLADKKEFDIFILFPPTLSISSLEKYGLNIGKKLVKKLGGTYVIEYAQHPYVSAKVDDISIDIVPCFAVKDASEIKSAVDRTPFHVRWLKKHLKKKQGNDVRLLKKFLKSHELYGADAKTQGFSGYLTELLIIKYRSFVRLLKGSVNWDVGEVIDLEGYYKRKDYPNLRKIFKNQPLIVIDPVDKNRNVAAALSIENFYRFKKYAKEFLDKPSKERFYGRRIEALTDVELSRIRFSRGTKLILIVFKPPKVVPDILWPQLRKFGERLKNILEEKKYEFRVYGWDVYTDEKEIALVLLEMETYSLPNVQKLVGPYVFDKKNSESFLASHTEPLVGPYIEDNKWVVEIERKFKTPEAKLVDSLNKPVKILKAKGIPSFIAGEIAKGFKVLETKEIENLIRNRKDIGVFLRKYFEKEKLV